MKSRFGLISLSIGALFLLGGCGGGSEEPAPDGTTPTVKNPAPDAMPAEPAPGTTPGAAPAPSPGGGPAGDKVPPL